MKPKVEGAIYEGLTVNFCKKIGANFILRGIRYVSDFEYEKTIADANRTLDKSLKPYFLPVNQIYFCGFYYCKGYYPEWRRCKSFSS